MSLCIKMHFAFSFLLKNMLFCYSLLAAKNHKTYQQIERSNNFFQKKSLIIGDMGALLAAKKSPPAGCGESPILVGEGSTHSLKSPENP